MAQIIDTDAAATRIIQLQSPDRSFIFPVDLMGFTSSEESDVASTLRQAFVGSMVGQFSNFCSDLQIPTESRTALRQTRYQVRKEANRYIPRLVRLAGEVNVRKILLAVDLQTMRDLGMLQLTISSSFYYMEILVHRVFSAVSEEARRIPHDSDLGPVAREHRRLAGGFYEAKMRQLFEAYCDDLLAPRMRPTFDMQSFIEEDRRRILRYFGQILGGVVNVARLLGGI